MNILFIPTNRLPFPPVRGGAVQNLTEFFVSWNEDNERHNITVYSIYDSDAEKVAKTYKNCKVKYINMSTLSINISKVIRHLINKFPNIYIGNAYITQIKKQLKSEVDKYDIIILENCPEYGLSLYNIAKGKLICHLHNDWLSKNTKLASKKLSCFENIWAISNYINKKVRQISNDDKIITLYNGIDNSKFNRELYEKDRDKLRKKYGIKENEVVILFSGRVVPQKGTKELVEAFVNLPDDLNAKLIIVGSKIYGETVKDDYLKKIKAISSKKKSKIIFTGYVNYNEMAKICAISDIGALPTLWEEPLSLTVIEYMSTGLPVVITNSGGMVELVDSTSAIIIDKKENIVKQLEDALTLLINDKQQRLIMGENAKKQANEFTKEKYCKELDFLLESFLKDKGKKVKYN